ncbi:hypothetical protein [Bradyrhizobium sp. sGM-13]|uniref:hypothetical protein n=1 Tax=Bradyrhizobium sp. sGM-13 TaxID=2831781 RepID=UPI001BCECF75|nr:hypothetical protein [Bradyrhizobium sp. sGM-13]
MTPEELANLRCWWFGSVHEISNIELQRGTWLAPPTPSPHWSFVEFCCSFPKPEQLQFGLDQGYLSASEFDQLAALSVAIARYKPQGSAYDHLAILSDPAWHAVVALAEKTRQALLHLTNDPIERGYLMDNPISSLRAKRSNP